MKRALIHISSVEAKRTFPFHSAYGASKHGIDAFLEALRVELMHEKLPISVTNVIPASINTPLFNKSRIKLGVKPQGLPPFYPPQAVADAILYVAENPTGDIVVGDAGQVMRFLHRLSPGLIRLNIGGHNSRLFYASFLLPQQKWLILLLPLSFL